MIQHEMTIASKVDLLPLDKVSENENVVKLVELPGNLVLFEYYHDILIGKWSHNHEEGPYLGNDPVAENKKREIEKDYINLLAPLYSKEVLYGLKTRYVKAIGFSINFKYYLFRTIENYKIIIDQMCFAVNCDENNFTVLCKNKAKKNIDALIDLIDEWSEWGKKQGWIDSYDCESVQDKEIICRVSFKEEPEDSIAALIALLTVSAKETKADKFHIDSP